MTTPNDQPLTEEEITALVGDVQKSAELGMRTISIELDDAMRLLSELRHLRGIVGKLRYACEAARDDDPCRLDHHGLCQSHHLRRNDKGEPECEQKLIRAALAHPTDSGGGLNLDAKENAQ